MKILLTFDTTEVLQFLGLALSFLGSIMLFGNRIGTWIKTSFDFTPIHFLIGLLMSLGTTLVLINWETAATPAYKVEADIYIDETIQIPATVQPPKKKVPPPPPPAPKKAIPKKAKTIKYEPVEQVVTAEPVIDQDEVEAPVLDTIDYREPAPFVPLPIEEEDPDEVILVPDQLPRFPGCELLDASIKDKYACSTEQLLEYLYDGIVYPALAKANGIEGLAVVQFVVEPDGSISQIELRRDPGGGCGKEAVRVIKLMNEMTEKWTPGRQKGRPVRVLYTLPVKFRLQH